jgi:integrase
MEKIKLTDRFIASRKDAPGGKRSDYHDSLVPGLALRVTDKGHKSFVLHGRFPLSPDTFTRRQLGSYPGLSLDDAREKAREWQRLMSRGIDPKVEEARLVALESQKHRGTFEAIAQDYLADCEQRKLAKAGEARATLEKDFIPRWRHRPAAEIMPHEISLAVKAIADRGAPYQAHNAYGWVRSLYSWAINKGMYGITTSPIAHLKPAAVTGFTKQPRSRILSDEELRFVWNAAAKMGYPYGAVFQLLIVTGQRETEVSEASRGERDMAQRLWTIPKERMKAARAHEVPLSNAAFDIFNSLPEFSGGAFVFSTTSGKKPLNGFSKAKVRLDRIIAEDRAGAGLEQMAPWVIHDLRRTVRTHFSALPVEDMVRELVIAHAKKGLHKVYDQFSYRDEKRRCLDLWGARLAGILNPAPATVTTLFAAR